MMGKEAYNLERGSYRAIGDVEKLERCRGRARTETERRSLGQRLRQVVVHMDNASDRYDRFEALRRQELDEAARLLLDVTGRESDRLWKVVGTVLPQLSHRYRASSAIENLNSVLRPCLVVQKHAEQGFLNLFQDYWSTGKRQWGRWKDTSAHELLTGEKLADWLSRCPRSCGRSCAALRGPESRRTVASGIRPPATAAPCGDQ
jgi:hypothetical protein